MLFIYAESPPLDENIPSHGLYRAGTPILGAIQDQIARIALYPMDRRYRLPQVAPSLRPFCRSLPLPFTLLRALRKRLLPDDFENGLVASIVGGWARRSAATQLLALEGSDPEVLARVGQIAASAGKPFSVYLVDDFEWTMRLNGQSEDDIARVAERMRRVLSRAAHTFAITDELGTLLRTQFGIAPVTLPLAFELQARPTVPVKDQIFFLGSVNFLYADALKVLIETVSEVRAKTGRDLTIRLTSASANMLGPLPAFVTAEPIEGADALAREIATSLFAFLPYSFDEKLKTMVTTSFPSKSMEYFAYARSIVTYAPSYSNSYRLFARHGLPTATRSREELGQIIGTHLQSRPDHNALYRDYLERFHSLRAVRGVLLETLGIT
jgi:hypothetical protein